MTTDRATPQATLRIRCPGCQKSLAIPKSAAGRRVACPQCQHAIAVPAGETPLAPAIAPTRRPRSAGPPALPVAPPERPPARPATAPGRAASGAKRRPGSGPERARDRKRADRPQAEAASGERLTPEERVGFLKRFGARLVDAVFVVVLGLGFGGVLGAVMGTRLVTGIGPQLAVLGPLGTVVGGFIGMFVGLLLVPPLYHLIEVATHRSPGKRLVGLGIADAEGFHASTQQLLVRYLWNAAPGVLVVVNVMLLGSSALNGLVSLYSLAWFVGCLAVLGTARQAFHDMMAGTAVYPNDRLVAANGPRPSGGGLSLGALAGVPAILAIVMTVFVMQVAKDAQPLQEAASEFEKLAAGGIERPVPGRRTGPLIDPQTFLGLAIKVGLGDELLGLRRAGSNVRTDSMPNAAPYATLTRTYQNGDAAEPRILAVIVDFADVPNSTIWTRCSWIEDSSVDGRPGTVSGPTETPQIKAYVGGRFLVSVTATGVARTDLRQLFEQLKLDILEQFATTPVVAGTSTAPSTGEPARDLPGRRMGPALTEAGLRGLAERAGFGESWQGMTRGEWSLRPVSVGERGINSVVCTYKNRSRPEQTLDVVVEDYAEVPNADLLAAHPWIAAEKVFNRSGRWFQRDGEPAIEAFFGGRYRVVLAVHKLNQGALSRGFHTIRFAAFE